jgi:hypothetical protein
LSKIIRVIMAQFHATKLKVPSRFNAVRGGLSQVKAEKRAAMRAAGARNLCIWRLLIALQSGHSQPFAVISGMMAAKNRLVGIIAYEGADKTSQEQVRPSRALRLSNIQHK